MKSYLKNPGVFATLRPGVKKFFPADRIMHQLAFVKLARVIVGHSEPFHNAPRSTVFGTRNGDDFLQIAQLDATAADIVNLAAFAAYNPNA